jgi:hypothetical protein
MSTSPLCTVASPEVTATLPLRAPAPDTIDTLPSSVSAVLAIEVPARTMTWLPPESPATIAIAAVGPAPEVIEMAPVLDESAVPDVLVSVMIDDQHDRRA